MAMIKARDTRPTIDLGGPDGNAYALIGYAKQFGRQLEWSQETIKLIQDEMMSGDYKNLVEVFDREFGDYVDLILPEGNEL